MNQPYFILVLAHSLHGRLRRFHVDHTVVYAVLALAFLGSFTLFGFVSSYVRMAWKVANYNTLRQETEFLRGRYQRLQNEANQTNDQLAHLQLFASEVSVAYGLKKPADNAAAANLAAAPLLPTLPQTLEDYNLLRTANIQRPGRLFQRRWLVNLRPSVWPVIGRLLSNFGHREDPFRGHQAFHTGVDISAGVGSPVRTSADGVVQTAEWSGAYGRLIVVDHGNGLDTYYGHLSRIDVMAGQEVRMGQVIGATGATGRVTSPHLHYEVRLRGSPVNPYPYLAKSALQTATTKRDFGF